MHMQSDIILNKHRYRLYREHKYIFHVFSDLIQSVATLDFSLKESLVLLKSEIMKLEVLLESHAEHEESRIHLILKTRDSQIFAEAENQHRNQKQQFKKLYEKINLIDKADENEATFTGYELYLDLRNFFNENLSHFDYEEKIIMPELQRLATDDEIREIDRITYEQMQPEQMIHMMEVLFTHMNCEDKFTFLDDIKDSDPLKFELAWSGIYPLIRENERKELARLLGTEPKHSGKYHA